MSNPVYDPYEEEKNTPQVTASAVEAFIQNPTSDTPLPTGPVPLTALSSETAGKIAGPAASGEPAFTEIPVNPTFEPTTPTDDGARKWNLSLPDIKDIVVEEAEKVVYLKATLLEESVEWTITIAGQPITIRSLSAYEQDVLFAALRADEVAGIITSPAAFGTWLQRYCMRLQVLQLSTKRVEPLVLPDDFAPAMELLRATTQAWVRKLSVPAFELQIAALRVFEGKMHVCAVNLHNESFWTPAS